MKNIKTILKRYRFFIAVLTVFLIITAVNRELWFKSTEIAGVQFKQMLLILPPIFILLGLMDVWVPKETMVKYMGEGSGLKGIVLAFLIGSAAAGPLYGAFPVAAVLMRKGVKFSNLMIFIGAWSTTKIPTLLFEVSSFGVKFALTRLLINIPGIMLIAYTLVRLMPKEEIEEIFKNAESMDEV
mgnify:FL=1